MAHILVIDDDAPLRRILRKLLEGVGFKVSDACNGAEGLEVIKREPTIELTITDIFMPEKEGVETILDIRDIRPDMKIIAMSGGVRYGLPEYLESAGKLGADRTLVKPFLPEDILRLVYELLPGVKPQGTHAAAARRRAERRSPKPAA